MIVITVLAEDGTQTHGVTVPVGMTTQVNLSPLCHRVYAIQVTNNEAPPPPGLREALTKAEETLEAIRRAGGWIEPHGYDE